MASASLRTARVLASPGTPSRSTWPRLRSPMRSRSSISFCPTITFRSSVRRVSTKTASCWTFSWMAWIPDSNINARSLFARSLPSLLARGGWGPPGPVADYSNGLTPGMGGSIFWCHSGPAPAGERTSFRGNRAPPLWWEEDVAGGRGGLGAPRATRKERVERALTERERLYMEAVEELYGEGD